MKRIITRVNDVYNKIGILNAVIHILNEKRLLILKLFIVFITTRLDLSHHFILYTRLSVCEVRHKSSLATFLKFQIRQYIGRFPT